MDQNLILNPQKENAPKKRTPLPSSPVPRATSLPRKGLPEKGLLHKNSSPEEIRAERRAAQVSGGSPPKEPTPLPSAHFGPHVKTPLQASVPAPSEHEQAAQRRAAVEQERRDVAEMKQRKIREAKEEAADDKGTHQCMECLTHFFRGADLEEHMRIIHPMFQITADGCLPEIAEEENTEIDDGDGPEVFVVE